MKNACAQRWGCADAMCARGVTQRPPHQRPGPNQQGTASREPTAAMGRGADIAEQSQKGRNERIGGGGSASRTARGAARRDCFQRRRAAARCGPPIRPSEARERVAVRTHSWRSRPRVPPPLSGRVAGGASTTPPATSANLGQRPGLAGGAAKREGEPGTSTRMSYESRMAAREC